MRGRWLATVAGLGLAGALATGCADGNGSVRPDTGGGSMDAAERDEDAFESPDSPAPMPDAHEDRDAGQDAGPPRTGQICDSCATDDDCGLFQHCAALTVGGRACVPTCDIDLPDCPRAFSCIIDVAVSTEPVCEPVGGPCCVDEDGDGYGHGVGCMGRDCDDADDARNPGEVDLCNSIDDDCDGMTDESSGELCDDGVDQDCDMQIDCADTDCADGAPCGPLGRVCAAGACACPGGATEAMCTGGTDDDCDGTIDCADTDCDGVACGADGRVCTGGSCGCPGGGTETACGDMMDNDCDGFIDCGDPNCASLMCGIGGRACVGGVCSCPTGVSEVSCEDGADTDCDGLIDCADTDCNTRTCGPRGRVCSAGSCRCPGGDTETMCTNGSDDDCDGTSDCADSDCGGRACGANGRVCIASACSCPSSSESCNGADDDCNGAIDNGCPSGTGLGAAATGTFFGGGGGGAFTLDCPAGSVMVGLNGRAASLMDRVQPICAPASLSTDTSTSPDYSYRLVMGAASAAGAAGGGGGSAYTDVCPTNELVIGIRGRSGSEVDQLYLQCGRVTLTRGGGGAWGVTITATGTTPVRGGSGGGFFTYDCPAGRVATGLAGRSGTRIDAIAARCSTVTMTTL